MDDASRAEAAASKAETAASRAETAATQLEAEAKKEVWEFRLKLLKDEIALQANAFDQIDSKTGVALGFTFVVVGQVLASVFRMSTDQNHFRNLHPCVTNALFGLANLSVLFAFFFGAFSRWPRSFRHSFEWEEKHLNGSTYLDLLESAVEALESITVENERTNTAKATWAKLTYLFVGVALVAYLVLTVFLYFFSIP
jgi:hypothetical protein